MAQYDDMEVETKLVKIWERERIQKCVKSQGGLIKYYILCCFCL